ncbi:hypothetical protein D9611_013718 [Ephemerocybe angulata]|uniref:Uncharacterized protein n=1 Tax=Ephemerocybe angulata TaxID=980116 RepID=A0A8H5F264_9AGAR|nr:hypothetical protein D9611_013718 [Tulosesus angulatus]
MQMCYVSICAAAVLWLAESAWGTYGGREVSEEHRYEAWKWSSNRIGGIAWSDAALAFFDSDIIAGPALVMFPFNSRGKPEAEDEDLWNWFGREG